MRTENFHPKQAKIFIKFFFEQQSSQFFSGINAVMFYSTSIFKDAGLGVFWSTRATILLSFGQLLTTFLTYHLIERAGRRRLLLASCIGMSLFAFTLALSMTLGVRITRFFLLY